MKEIKAIKCGVCDDVIVAKGDMSSCTCGEVYFGINEGQQIFGAKDSQNVFIEEDGGSWVSIPNEYFS